MIRFIQKRPDAVVLLLAGYFLLNIVVRLILPNTLEIDEAEQIFVSQWLAVGYDTQPPFYNWVQHAIIALAGPTVLSLAIAKNLLLFCFYLFYWLSARLLLNNRALAVIATLSLLTIPQVAFESQRDLTHTVAVIFCATFFFYWFVRTLRSPSALSYALTGLAVGAGMIAKYNFALLPAAALIAILFDADMRRRLFDWRLLLTVGVALAVFLPHGLWLMDNLQLASERTLEKMTAGSGFHVFGQIPTGFLSLIKALIGFSAVTVLLLVLVFGKRLPAALSASTPWTRLIERMLLLLMASLVFLILFMHTEHIKDRWLTPFLILLPLYICLKLEASGAELGDALKRFLPIPLAIMVIIPTMLLVRVYGAGYVGTYSKTNVPYREFAEAVVNAMGTRPGLIMAVDPHLAGNMRLIYPDIPVDTLLYPGFKPTYTWDAQHPILFVWRQRGEANAPFPATLGDWLVERAGPDAMPEIHDIALPYNYGRAGDLYHFGYAWVYPK